MQLPDRWKLIPIRRVIPYRTQYLSVHLNLFIAKDKKFSLPLSIFTLFEQHLKIFKVKNWSLALARRKLKFF